MTRLGSLLAKIRRTEEAEAAYRGAVEHYRRLVSDYPAMRDYVEKMSRACDRLAGHFADMGRTADAIGAYREALKLNAANARACNNLAWILATAAEHDLRDPAEAVRAGQAGRRVEFEGSRLLEHARRGSVSRAPPTTPAKPWKRHCACLGLTLVASNSFCRWSGRDRELGERAWFEAGEQIIKKQPSVDAETARFKTEAAAAVALFPADPPHSPP